MVRLKKLSLSIGSLFLFVLGIIHYGYKNLPDTSIHFKSEFTTQTIQNSSQSKISQSVKPDAVILGVLPPLVDIPRERTKLDSKKPGKTVIIGNYSTVRKLSFPRKSPPLGVIPVGRRPLIPNPEKYALQMIRLKVRLEVLGINSLSKTAKNKANLTKLAFEKKKIVLLTYWRCGSSFIGEVLNRQPGTFYSFEPLHSLTLNQVINDSVSESKAISLMSDILRCNYKNNKDYFKWVSKAENQFLVQHNTRLWSSCRIRPNLCFDPKFVEEACGAFPVQLIKVTRLSLGSMNQILSEFPDLKLVHLVRDPRGIMSSRMSLPWCNSTKYCIDTDVLCERMRNDLLIFSEFQREYPNRLTLVRYEDISTTPEEKVQEMFKFLGLKFDKKVISYINSHTRLKNNESQGGPYSTKRNSKTAPFAWRFKLSFAEVSQIQESCSDVITNLGYKFIRNENELRDSLTVLS